MGRRRKTPAEEERGALEPQQCDPERKKVGRRTTLLCSNKRFKSLAAQGPALLACAGRHAM